MLLLSLEEKAFVYITQYSISYSKVLIGFNDKVKVAGSYHVVHWPMNSITRPQTTMVSVNEY